MRHRKKGRRLGRSSSHRKAMLRNLAASLILTERDDEYYEDLYQADEKTPVMPPSHKGRVVTTLHKAKEVRSLVEKCVTIARKAIPHDDKASEFETEADRNSAEWESWRQSDQWKQWVAARAPGVAARRRVYDILQNKEAVSILFEDIAPRFEDRPGGYTRIMRLAKPRLGDAGTRAILEFVGENDRANETSERPEFDMEDEASASDVAETEAVEESTPEPVEEAAATDEAVAEDSSSDESTDSDSEEKKE